MLYFTIDFVKILYLYRNYATYECFLLNSYDEKIGLKVAMTGRKSYTRRSDVDVNEFKVNYLFVHLIFFKNNEVVYIIYFFYLPLHIGVFH